MSDPSLFKWRHFEADMILCTVRWSLRHVLSYRDGEELLRERGVYAVVLADSEFQTLRY
jgi:transposase-like protein